MSGLRTPILTRPLAALKAGLIALAAPLALGLALGLASVPLAHAVQPDEMLADPGLETRARMISREIRCPVCQSESIDDSTAPISRDLRLIIRERLVAGDSNDEVIDFIVARYGEFVHFNPRPSGWNLVLWAAGPVMFLMAAGGVWLVLRRAQNRSLAPAPGLSEAEERRLREILSED